MVLVARAKDGNRNFNLGQRFYCSILLGKLVMLAMIFLKELIEDLETSLRYHDW